MNARLFLSFQSFVQFFDRWRFAADLLNNFSSRTDQKISASVRQNLLLALVLLPLMLVLLPLVLVSVLALVSVLVHLLLILLLTPFGLPLVALNAIVVMLLDVWLACRYWHWCCWIAFGILC